MTEAVRALLQETSTWAVVGCSPDPRRDSHRVAAFLQRAGFKVIPVNPNHTGELLGERCYPTCTPSQSRSRSSTSSAAQRPAGHHVDEAIALNATGVWLQLGVIDHAAAARARAAGLKVVMDRCPAIELPRLLSGDSQLRGDNTS